jgi:ATP-dependent helicase/nuclease subunit B
VIGLFDGSAPRLRAAPASAPFLELLANAMADALYRADDPFSLSDALVLLPNRRAARGLIDAFAKRLGGAALLPAIRPLGDPDLDDDSEVWGADALTLDLPPVIDATRERMELASLIRARDKAQGGVDDPVRALALADELRRLISSAATAEHVAWDKLPTLVQEIDLAKHWSLSAKFLSIVADYWPKRLEADGLAGRDQRRTLVLTRLAEAWEANPPDRPIIIAGSTGSFAVTRKLMNAVARLPRGVVVLPGLDVDLDDGAWDAVDDQHPQFALKQTLAALGVERRDVPMLAEETPQGRARRVLIREALAPAEKTADWLTRIAAAGGAEFVAQGADGLRLVEAATEDEEATAIALMLREALETPSRTAALVTPDATLARRVEAKLARWGAAALMTHARPLRETPPGALISLLCELAEDPGEPVALAALLKHPLTQLGANASTLAALEHQALRGPRRYKGLGDLAALDKLEKFESARELVLRAMAALAPLAELMHERRITLAQFATALTLATESVASESIFLGYDGETLWKLLQEAIQHGNELGDMPPHAAPRLFLKLVEGKEALHPSGGEARIAVFGLLEARLQRRDLMILGGLNEGVWPQPAPEDPFLSRPMRAMLGLPSLDQRIGLAAHDFAQLANAPDVVLTRALRRDGSPTLASRWLWRLQTLAKGAGRTLTPDEAPIAWAQALDAPTAPRNPIVPQPRPPAHARIKRISVTQVETLIRDPYALYARRILGLNVLDPIGVQPSHRERGTAVHAAIERFGDGNDSELLLSLLLEELEKAGFPHDRLAAERARLGASVRALVSWFGERADAKVFREIKGALDLRSGATLSAQADRIEIWPDQAGAILDFKTGAPPSVNQVASGIAPQLTLQTAMLARGAFEGIPRAIVREIVYWRVGGREPAPKALEFKDTNPAELAEEALGKLESMMAAYARETQPFLSSPRVQFAAKYRDYDHLARRKEWADAEGDE